MLNDRFCVCEEQTRTCATAQKPECQQARAPRNPALPRLFFQVAGVTVPAPAGWSAGLVFLWCVLPLSLLSSLVFPCCFPGSCLEAGGAQQPLRPSEGLAGVVVPRLLVAVMFPPTREGSGTISTGRRPKNRASFRYSPTVSLYVLGLRFLAPPAVTSASEVLTQTYRSFVRVLRFP